MLPTNARSMQVRAPRRPTSEVGTPPPPPAPRSIASQKERVDARIQHNIEATLTRITDRAGIYMDDESRRIIAHGLAPAVLHLPFARPRVNEHTSAETVYMTQQQKRALLGVAHGLGPQEIGDIIGLSGHTVKTHLKKAYMALRVHNAAHAVATAMSLGVITADEINQFTR